MAFVEHRAAGHARAYLGVLLRSARAAGAQTLVMGPASLAEALADEPMDAFVALPDLWAAPRWRREPARFRFVWWALAEARRAGVDLLHWAHLDTIVVPVAWLSGAAPAAATLHRTYFLAPGGRVGRAVYRRLLVTQAFRRLTRAWPVFVHDEGVAAALASRLGVGVQHVCYPATVDGWPQGEARAHRRVLQRRAWGLDDDAVALLAFGGTRVEKRLDVAVAALHHLPPHVHLVVEGAPQEVGGHEIAAWARAADVAGRVLLRLGHVDEVRVPDVFAACDAVVAPYATGFGGVSGPVSLAAAYGVPVVVSDIPELAAGLRAFRLGAFARPGDAVSLAEAVTTALAQPPAADDTARFVAAHHEAQFGRLMVAAYLEALGLR